MAWSATLLLMVNYNIGEKDQPYIHAIDLNEFLVLWNAKLEANGEMAPLFHDFQHGYMRNSL